jgi:hypothetical protein
LVIYDFTVVIYRFFAVIYDFIIEIYSILQRLIICAGIFIFT